MSFVPIWVSVFNKRSWVKHLVITLIIILFTVFIISYLNKYNKYDQFSLKSLLFKTKNKN